MYAWTVLSDSPVYVMICTVDAFASQKYATSISLLHGALALKKNVPVNIDFSRRHLKFVHRNTILETLFHTATALAWKLQEKDVVINKKCDSRFSALKMRAHIRERRKSV